MGTPLITFTAYKGHNKYSFCRATKDTRTMCLWYNSISATIAG